MARYHSPWKPEEEELLTRLHHEGYNYVEISEQLPGRTHGACRDKAIRLGLSKPGAVKIIMAWAERNKEMKMEGI